MSLLRRLATLVLAPLLVALTGCGATPAPVAAMAEPTFYKRLNARDVKVDPVAARDLISVYRRNKGLATVAVDPTLQRVAQRQVEAMAAADTMSHTIRGDLPTRLAAEGIVGADAVENVSAGYLTLAEAFSGWRQSPHHDANMLSRTARRMGIATAYAPNSKYRVYWALVMTD